MSEIKHKIELNGIVVSRMPSWAKEVFKEMAKERFADDFGMTISYLLTSTLEYERLKEMFFNNQLNVKLLLEPNAPQKVNADDNQRTNLRGEPISTRRSK